MNTLKKGRECEDKAAVFYSGKGYTVVRRNYRRPGGEIDLICIKDGCLVFVEVKSVPENWDSSDFQKKISSSKIRKIKKTANYYLIDKIDEFYEKIRFDVIFVSSNRIFSFEGAF